MSDGEAELRKLAESMGMTARQAQNVIDHFHAMRAEAEREYWSQLADVTPEQAKRAFDMYVKPVKAKRAKGQRDE